MSTTFASLGVPDAIARTLADRGIEEAFPIQAATLPDALAGRDLCGKAPTGSGKTIAFGIPMVSRVTRSAPKRPKGLVLAPTRELALQVADELTLLGDLRVLAVYGGAGIEPQIKKLRAGVDIVVACPGRLLDVIDRGACDLRDVSFAVVDEADRMADMGFLPDVRRILDQTSAKRQTLLFSATLDGAVDALVREYQRNPVVHEIEDEETGDVVHHFWLSERQGRAQLAAEIVERVGPTVVFSRTRHGADRIAKQLGQVGVSAAAIHGNRSQAQRERALGAFHRGEVKALVATDVAARGIHVEGVLCVIHFDIPADPKDYVHRSGRTGRAGNLGTVVALVPEGQKRDAAKLRKAAGIEGSLVEPDVSLLPEGHASFRAAAHAGRGRQSGGGSSSTSSGKATGKGPGKGAGTKPAKARTDDRYRTDRPERVERARPERTERVDRADRVERPARSQRPGRTEREVADLSSPWSSRDSAIDAVDRGPNRAERRQERFTDAERQARAAAKAKPSGGSPAGRAPKPASGRTPSASSPSSDPLERSLSASPKVRPSGASRRKAKREALEAAGQPASGTKKRRSGKPRPPAAKRRG